MAITQNRLESDTNSRARVLHLIKWLPRGGIETWLTHIFSRNNDFSVRNELLVMKEDIGPYEDRVRSAGIPIHVLPISNKLTWFSDFYHFLKREGPFAVVHSHHDPIISGPALTAAKFADVPVRIAHNHAARLMGEDYQALRHRVREGIGRKFVEFGATRRIGISDQAMWHLVGSGWQSRSDCSILLYGFDYSAYASARVRAEALRSQYGLAKDAPVIGHVGRFDQVKNHPFLIETFARFSRVCPNAHMILIGRGPLESEVRADIAAHGLDDKITIVPGSDDVAAHMALFDVFLFPSFSEGLGIVVLEAQAAGTPTLMTDSLPPEVIVVPEAVQLLPLAAGPTAWAEMLLDMVGKERAADGDWLERVEKSHFGIDRCVSDLDKIYADELGLLHDKPIAE
jgi:glycosyltransferase involved in cell wall biosynthesis